MNLTKNLAKGFICKEKHHQHDVFTNILRMVLYKHAPIKKKLLRGNEAPFMTKELSKAIMNRSKLKNRLRNGHLVKPWHLRSRRISVRILTKRRKRTTFPKLLQRE